MCSKAIIPHLAWVSMAALVLGQGDVQAAEKSTRADPVRDSVVKIFATHRVPNLTQPWLRSGPSEVSGTGVVIEGKRILTNAHVVSYASQIFVRPQGSSARLAATVVIAVPSIDLAVLKLDDESFFNKRTPIPRVPELPEVKDNVTVYGYPTGGDSLSITKGIVSRIEFTGYTLNEFGLRIQVDAAINPGNSGGPALVDDKLVGLVFSHLDQAENIGYIIPTEEIELFLKDVADGRYDGKAAMYDELQTLENDAIRKKFKLGSDVSGMVVRKPDRDDPSYPLKAWDVITRVGSHDVDDTGQVQVKEHLRLQFGYLVQKLAREGKIPLTVVRGGKPIELALPVGPKRDQLIAPLQGRRPSYFIYGPLSFTAVTSDFVDGNDESDGVSLPYFVFHDSPVVTRRHERVRFAGEQLVVVPAPMFPHPLGKGYSSPSFQVVKDINGTAVRNLSHLVELLRDMKDPYVTIRFCDRMVEDLVFDHQEMLRATEEVLSDNGIRQQASDDLMPLWNKKK